MVRGFYDKEENLMALSNLAAWSGKNSAKGIKVGSGCGSADRPMSGCGSSDRPDMGTGCGSGDRPMKTNCGCGS